MRGRCRADRGLVATLVLVDGRLHLGVHQIRLFYDINLFDEARDVVDVDLDLVIHFGRLHHDHLDLVRDVVPCVLRWQPR